MSFWIRDLEKPRCACGKPAHVEVMNSYNASQGRFCKRCGAAKVRELERRNAEPQGAGAPLRAPKAGT